MGDIGGDPGDSDGTPPVDPLNPLNPLNPPGPGMPPPPNDPVSNPTLVPAKLCVDNSSISFEQQVKPILVRNCVTCHSGVAPSGKFAMDKLLANEATARAQMDRLVRMDERIMALEMPPSGTRMTNDELRIVREWIYSLPGEPDVAWNGLRRLTRTEYANTVRDLLGLPDTFNSAAALPAETTAYSFTRVDEASNLINDTLTKGLIDGSIRAVDTFFAGAATNAAYARTMACSRPIAGNERACAQEILERFLPRAYRRPATATEVTEMLGQYDKTVLGTIFEERMKLVFQSVLLTPSFLYQVELDPAGATGVRALGDHELATRLSYFLWSSMPDDELFRLAGMGQLKNAQVLTAQFDRLYASPRRSALLRGFAREWLRLGELDNEDTVAPALRTSMAKETELFMQELLSNPQLPVARLVDADFTFVDAALRTHYGLPAGDPAFAKVPTAGTARVGGILTQAAFLTLSSPDIETAPVIRGHYVLDNLLCSAPPPPPPEVESLIDKVRNLDLPKKEQMLMHAQGTCISCHANMEPIGFGLEHFGPQGKYRTVEGPKRNPVDASGYLPTGETFRDHTQLAKVLAGKQALGNCASRRLMVYALGRQVPGQEACGVHQVSADANRVPFKELVRRVVTGRSFRSRRGGTP